MSEPDSRQWSMDTEIGLIYLVASESGLRGVFWKRQAAPRVKSLGGSHPADKMLARGAREIEEYLAGKRKRFEVPVDAGSAKGTPFQEQVWAELRKIPYGRTRTYGEIAARLGRPKASRAVGTANGRNPFSIIVPCHRVLAAGGKLGGYAGGLFIKSRLLELEKKA